MDITIQLKESDLISFQMYYSYRKIQTWIFTILGVAILVLSFTTVNKVEVMYTMLYIFAGVMFMFYTPLNIRSSAKRAFKLGLPVSQPMKYHFDEQGVAVGFADQSANNAPAMDTANSITWDMVYKVEETKKAILLYTSPKNASILPLEQLGEKAEELKQLFKQELEPFKYGC
ncbi:MAG: YcxB family protein [Lachnospiraceae bacterium]|nr:YcxB family protein [Lachnospiraceae bacterium]